mgnify:CR=1 FL=1
MVIRAVAAVLIALLAAAPGARAADGQMRVAGRQLWSTDFEHPIEFQTLVDSGVLVVATSRHLYGVDQRAGKVLWRKRDVHVAPEDLLSVPGSRILLINEDAGGKFADQETSTFAINVDTGDDLWETKLIKGKGMQAVADAATGTLVLVSVRKPHGDDLGAFAGWLPGDGIGGGFSRKPRISAIDLATGKLRWDKDCDDEVQLRPTFTNDVATVNGRASKDRPFDLGLYRPPIIAGNQVFVTYDGLTCYDVATGKRLWRQQYSLLEGDFALSASGAIVTDDAVYATGEGRIRAFDRATGKQLWKTDDFGVIPELFLDDQTVYGQLGGRFFNISSENWVWKGSYGAVAVDRRTGKQVWKFDSGNDSTTSLAIVGDRVWLGDEEHLIGLDRANGTRVVAERHGLDHRPVLATFNERGEVVLISDDEAVGFSTGPVARAWYQKHPAIGPSGWRRFAAGLLMTSGAVLSVSAFAAAHAKGLLPALPSPALRVAGLQPIPLLNTRTIAIKAATFGGREMWRAGSGMLGVTQFAHLTGTHQYFLTRLSGADQALAGVNLTTGETDRAVALPARTANIAIDEETGVVTQARGKQLVGLALDAR